MPSPGQHAQAHCHHIQLQMHNCRIKCIVANQSNSIYQLFNIPRSLLDQGLLLALGVLGQGRRAKKSRWCLFGLLDLWQGTVVHRNLAFIFLYLFGQWEKCLKLPKWGREVIFAVNSDLADILGDMDLDFESFHF